MMNDLHASDSPTPETALHSAGGHGITIETLAMMQQQQVPQAPQSPATPQVQGMSQEAREAIADAIREAQRATAEAREQARQAQEQARQAQEEAQGPIRVTVGPDRILVPGAQGGGFGQGGLVPPPPPGPFDNVPPQVFDIVLAFFFMIAFIAVGTAVARAFGRRAENRPVQVAANPEVAAQLQRIEHAVEAMAIEVERISEAQRYMARLESERVADPALLGRPGRRE